MTTDTEPEHLLEPRAPAPVVPMAPARFRDVASDLQCAAPPWPEARQAAELGESLGERLAVPFHFASPDQPNDRAPRWRTTT